MDLSFCQTLTTLFEPTFTRRHTFNYPCDAMKILSIKAHVRWSLNWSAQHEPSVLTHGKDAFHKFPATATSILNSLPLLRFAWSDISHCISPRYPFIKCSPLWFPSRATNIPLQGQDRQTDPSSLVWIWWNCIGILGHDSRGREMKRMRALQIKAAESYMASLVSFLSWLSLQCNCVP